MGASARQKETSRSYFPNYLWYSTKNSSFSVGQFCQPHLPLFSAIATGFLHFLMLNCVPSDQIFTSVFELSLLCLPFLFLASWSSLSWFSLKQKGASVRTQTLPFLFLFKLGTWSSRFLAFCKERTCSDEVDGAALLSLREPARPGGHWGTGGGICKQFTKCYNSQRPLFHSIWLKISATIQRHLLFPK